MEIRETKIAGAFVCVREPFRDERGEFSRIFCKNEFEARGMCGDIAQANFSQNHKKGTLRGLHSQKADCAEDKLVFCVQGAIYDVCVDVRADSPTYGKYIGETLTADNQTMLYVPKGCAHGYLTLEDDSRVAYLVTQFYSPGSEVGYRYDDPFFGIEWPIPSTVISEKDRAYPYIGARGRGEPI